MESCPQPQLTHCQVHVKCPLLSALGINAHTSLSMQAVTVSTQINQPKLVFHVELLPEPNPETKDTCFSQNCSV